MRAVIGWFTARPPRGHQTRRNLAALTASTGRDRRKGWPQVDFDGTLGADVALALAGPAHGPQTVEDGRFNRDAPLWPAFVRTGHRGASSCGFEQTAWQAAAVRAIRTMGMRFIAGLVMKLTGIYRLDEPQDAI